MHSNCQSLLRAGGLLVWLVDFLHLLSSPAEGAVALLISDAIAFRQSHRYCAVAQMMQRALFAWRGISCF